MNTEKDKSTESEKLGKKTWSRLAIGLGILACLASPLSWYFGLSLAAAVLAMLLALVGLLRGERSRAAWFWPILALILGTVVYAVYLQLTGPVDQAQAQQIIDKNFAGSFENDFANLVGDAGHKAASDEDAGKNTAW